MKTKVYEIRKQIENYKNSEHVDEWKLKYLEETLKNEILRNRLYYCKNDNNKLKKQYIDCIKFLLHDKNDLGIVRKVSDVTWDLDRSLSIMIADVLRQFKLHKEGYPSIFDKKYKKESTAVKKWDKTIDTMIEAFYIISSDLDYHFDATLNKKVKTGLKNFAKYYPNLWI